MLHFLLALSLLSTTITTLNAQVLNDRLYGLYVLHIPMIGSERLFFYAKDSFAFHSSQCGSILQGKGIYRIINKQLHCYFGTLPIPADTAYNINIYKATDSTCTLHLHFFNPYDTTLYLKQVRMLGRKGKGNGISVTPDKQGRCSFTIQSINFPVKFFIYHPIKHIDSLGIKSRGIFLSIDSVANYDIRIPIDDWFSNPRTYIEDVEMVYEIRERCPSYLLLEKTNHPSSLGLGRGYKPELFVREQ